MRITWTFCSPPPVGSYPIRSGDPLLLTSSGPGRGSLSKTTATCRDADINKHTHAATSELPVAPLVLTLVLSMAGSEVVDLVMGRTAGRQDGRTDARGRMLVAE